MNIEILILPMVFIPIVCGLLPMALKDVKMLNMITVLVSVAELLMSLTLMINANYIDNNVISIDWISGFGVSFSINGLGILMAVVTSIVFIVAGVFAGEYFDSTTTQNLQRFYSFFMITLGATLGVFLSHELFTMFIFIEIMSYASYLLVVHSQTDNSIKAGNSYLAFAILGGLVTLTGMFMLHSLTHTVVISEIAQSIKPYIGTLKLTIIGFLIFFGFAAKSALFPLNDWLSKSYTEAPTPASLVLSGIINKTGLYGIVIVTLKVLSGNIQWANFVMILGVLTMLIGSVYAVVSTNLKKTLSYSSMSQLGLIAISIAMAQLGAQNAPLLALGTVFAMVAHTLITVVLFACAGVIYRNTNNFELDKIQGFGKGKVILIFCFCVATIALIAVSLCNRYSTMIFLQASSIKYSIIVKLALMLNGGLTVAYATKLLVSLFIKKVPEIVVEKEKPYITAKTSAVLLITTVMILALLVFPAQLLQNLSKNAVEFITLSAQASVAKNNLSIVFIGVSVVVGAIVYLLTTRVTFVAKKEISAENLLWQPLVFEILPFVFGFIGRVIDKSSDMFLFAFQNVFMRTAKIPNTFFEGKKYADDKKVSSPAYSITKSLAYSLLLFGIGFVLTLLYLLIGHI